MKNVDTLKEWIEVNRLCIHQIKDTRLFVRDFIRTHKKNRKRHLLISILVRCSTNLTSIAILTKFMIMSKTPLYLNLSVGILLRNCYMDALLGLYLNDQDECHIEEIAEVLNADYVKALFEQFEVYRDKIEDTCFDEDFLEHIYTMCIEDNYLNYLELNEDTKDIKPGNERYIWKAMPKDKIRTLIPKKVAKRELDIKTIWETLKCNEMYADCANKLYDYYKCFSQFEHFSEAGNGNTLVSSEDDNINMVKAVERLIEAVRLITHSMTEAV